MGLADAGVPTNGDTSAAAIDAAPPPPCTAFPPPARGATVPYQEYEAEDGRTNGTTIGPSRAVNDADVFNSIAGESSGRKAVKLAGTGQNIAFTSKCIANSIVVRYVIPDSADGTGVTATLGVYVNGARVVSLPLTSHFAWAYGNPQTNPTSNNPSDGFARHFYDEARLLLPSEIPAGATVTLQQDASDTAPYYVIDLVDLEEVTAPLAQPQNSLSVTDCGATPDDATDDGPAIQKCIFDAQTSGKSVWLPPGTYEDSATPLLVRTVEIHGAGMWWTTIHGAAAQLVCQTDGCKFFDLALTGEVDLRDDAHGVHAMEGVFGKGCRIENLWIEHFTTGPWVGVSGAPAPPDSLVVHGCRFRDLFADGLNLSNGTSHSTVEQSTARNTGDDAFASWSIGTSPPNTGNVFQFDTVQVPWLANCFAIYGGSGNAIQDSTCADGVTYNGIFVDQGFSSNAFGGTTTIARDSVYRSGGSMYGKPWGSLTVSGNQSAAPITGVQIQDIDIEDSTFSGLFFIGPKDAITGLLLDGLTITNPGTYGINVDPSALGSANATNVVVMNPGSGTGLNNPASGFTLNRVSGDVGW
jgi:hypothetical protein